MGLETGTYIDSLVITNPTATDNRSEGDDHLRLLKSTVKSTFPNISGAVTPTHTELNYVDGVTSAIQTQIDSKVATTSDLLKGSWRLIKTQTASASTNIDFINGVSSVVLDSTYDVYMVRFVSVVLGGNPSTLAMRTTTNASTFATSGYTYTRMKTSASAWSGYQWTLASQIDLIDGFYPSSISTSGEIMIYKPSAAAPLLIKCDGVALHTSNECSLYHISGANTATADVDGLRFFDSQGSTITSGTFALYGLVK